MLFEPLANAGDRALVGIRRRMRTVEDTNFVEQDDGDAASFTFADLGPEIQEQRLDIAPLNVCADRMRTYDLKRSLVLPFHMNNGTIKEYCRKWKGHQLTSTHRVDTMYTH